MTLDEFLSEELDDCERRYSADYRQAIRALILCSTHGLPLPDWLANEAESAMRFALLHGGSEGRGKTGGHKAKLARDLMHRTRHQIAEHELARRVIVGGNRDDAFARAQERLVGTAAQGSVKAITRSHALIQKRYRDPTPTN